MDWAINLGIQHALTSASGDDAILVIKHDLEIDYDYLKALQKVWRANPNTVIGSVVVDISNPDVIADGGSMLTGGPPSSRS